MSLETSGLIIILLSVIFLFFTEKVSADLAALCALLFFIILGYLTPREAFSGFSSSVVLTIIPMFMIGAGLRLTGLADSAARLITNNFGNKESVNIAVIMIVGVIFSSFMNNIAATALLMPTVIGIAHRASHSPSRLLIPLSFATMLGGAITLIGTAPNIVASQILLEQGSRGLKFFDFTLFGSIISLVGIAYMVFLGRHLLPDNKHLLTGRGKSLSALYHLHEYIFALRVTKKSGINNETLANLHFAENLGVNVVAIANEAHKVSPAGPSTVVSRGDTLLVNGAKSHLQELMRFRGVRMLGFDFINLEEAFAVKSLEIKDEQAGQTVRELSLFSAYSILAFAMERDGEITFQDLAHCLLKKGDLLHVIVSGHSNLEELLEDFSIRESDQKSKDNLLSIVGDNLRLLELPDYSELAGISLKDSKMSALTGLVVLAAVRGQEIVVVTDSDFKFLSKDKLIVLGETKKINSLSKLGELELLSTQDSTAMLESIDTGLMEVVLAPRSQLISKTVMDINFREKYDMNIIALWREGNAVLHDFKKIPFKFGDALLLHGLRSKIQLFAKDPDFVVLRESLPFSQRKNKMLYALLSIFMLLAVSSSGLFSIETAAWIAAAVLILSGTITMEEGYREVDWKIVVLVACILPIGIIFDKLNIAQAFSAAFIQLFAESGVFIMLAFLVVLTSLVSQMLEGTLAVLFFVPLALSLANQFSIDPHIVAIVIAISASNAFLTPFSHRSHLLVMGAGAYQLKDYLRVGFPLTIILHLALLLLLYLKI